MSKFCESKYVEYRYFIKKCDRNIHKIKEYVPIYSTKLLAKVETAGSSPVYRFRLKVSKPRIYVGFGTFSLKEDNINVSNGYGRGTITDALQHALQKVGIPKTFAGIGARLIVFVLF